MNFLIPRLRLAWLKEILLIAVAGALIAGLYGVLHDQITYSLGPEYFTRLKFRQFAYADMGWPRRVFVAQIGFLASWWVGLIAGWVLARIAVPVLPVREARAWCLRGFGWVFAGAVTVATAGFLLGCVRGPAADYSNWQWFATELGVTDLPRFVRVAYIHNGSYLGGLIGLVAALLRRRRAVAPDAASFSGQGH